MKKKDRIKELEAENYTLQKWYRELANESANETQRLKTENARLRSHIERTLFAQLRQESIALNCTIGRSR